MTIKFQSQQIEKQITFEGKPAVIIANIRHDDHCGNGHNSFAITGEIWKATKGGTKTGGDCELCGCIHDEIFKHFPELRHLLKWHLSATDGPMHYIANTLYWAKEGNFDHARSTAVAPEATKEQLQDESWLQERLPALLVDFRKDVETFGLTWDKGTAEI